MPSQPRVETRGYKPYRRIHGLKPVATNGIVPGGTLACYTLLLPTRSHLNVCKPSGSVDLRLLNLK